MLSELGYLFICCFRMWVAPESNRQMISTQRHEQELQIISEDCTSKKVFKNFLCVCLFFTAWLSSGFSSILYCFVFCVCMIQKVGQDKDVMGEVYKTHEAIQ